MQICIYKYTVNYDGLLGYQADWSFTFYGRDEIGSQRSRWLGFMVMKHSCSIYYYLCVLTNITNTCTYRFDLSQSDLNNRSENLVQKTFKKIFDIFLRRKFGKEHIDLFVLS